MTVTARNDELNRRQMGPRLTVRGDSDSLRGEQLLHDCLGMDEFSSIQMKLKGFCFAL